MPTAEFIVTVTSRKSASNEALVDVGQYLAYCDTTDLFGYHGHTESTSTQLHDGEWYIDIRFSAPVSQEADITKFLQECDSLSRVEDAKCLTNPSL